MEERLVMVSEDRDIYFFGEDKVLKDDLENGLNRDLQQVSTLDDFTSGIGASDMTNATVILTNNLHAEIRGYLDDVVYLLELAISNRSNTVVIEVGIDSKVVMPNEVSPYVFRYTDAVEVIKDRRKEVRGVTVERAMTDEGALEYQEAFQDFQREIAENERKIDKLEISNTELDNRVKQLRKEVKAIEGRYQKVQIEWDNMENEGESLREQLQVRTEDLERTIIELDDIRQRYEGIYTAANDHRYENIALNKQKKERDDKIMGLTYEVKDLRDQISSMRSEREDLIHRMSGFDDYGDIGEELNHVTKEKGKLEEELMNAKVNLKHKEIEFDELEDKLNELGKDEVEMQEFGRSLGDAHSNLRSVKLYYFKVIHEIPYFNSHIEKFIKILNENTDGHGIVKTCIIRYDEGFDAEYFNGVGIYSNLGNAKEGGENRFRLYPSRKMFLGAEEFEDTVDTLVVLDYTRNNNYMIDTDSESRKFNVITNSKLKHRLNLRGNDISTDETASLPLVYDREIASSRLSENKSVMIEEKVRRWMRKIEIIS